jgi:phospholipase C
MWQQSDCDTSKATAANPSGCRHDLYPWVGTSVGWALSNIPPPTPFTDESTFQGGISMGYYNMANGDVPYFESLAQQFAISDNYHQFQLGGTGPNSITIGTASPLIFTDANGNPATPPSINIENPNVYAGSNNWYQNDGFYLGNTGSTSNGSYTNCSDATQPGVAPIQNYLKALPYKPFNGGNCTQGNY